MFLGLQIFGLDGSKFLVSGGFKFWYGGVDIFGFGILVWRGPICWFGVGPNFGFGRGQVFWFVRGPILELIHGETLPGNYCHPNKVYINPNQVSRLILVHG